jgi:hypothetical protein
MNYNFQETLTRVWEKAVDLYQGGQRDSSTFPIDDDLPFLSLLGMNKMDVFDYAEDWVLEGTPDLATFLLIHEQRRDYFIEVQKRTPSSKTLDTGTLPAKTETIEGIHWLPRIIPKARAKLRGELPASSMFCCGGDRHFFQTNDINPAEFLRVVKKAEEQDQVIIDWVLARVKENNL